MSGTCRGEVVDAVVEICGLRPDQLIDDATLDGLQIDSLDLIEIGMIIEEHHDVQLNSDDFEGIDTFGDAVAVFDRLVATGTSR